MRRSCVSVLACLAVAAPCWAQSLSPSAELGPKVRAAVEAMLSGEHYRSADSGTLAWGESYVLNAFYWMYEATGEEQWLERMIERADVIFANLSPGDELHPGWRTSRYSVAIVEATPHPDNRSAATLTPDPARIYHIETAHRVTGHSYQVRVLEGGAIEIEDLTERTVTALPGVPADGRLRDLPGVVLVLAGEPQPGDRFEVATQAPRPLEYVVHDGMILTPIAQLCAAVLGDPGLSQAYGEAVRRYLDIMENQLIPKWEPHWRDFGEGAGAYLAQPVPAQRFAGATLPHNQYLALGRTHVALYRITGKPLYRQRAEAMARFLKRNLRLVDDHYEWNYWDYAGPWDEDARRMAVVEDTSHGHIDVGFALDAYDVGLVFDRQDLERFARTLSEAMWNGDPEQPRLGARVNTREGDQAIALDWVRLGRFSPQARRIMVGMLESLERPTGGTAAAGAQALALERAGWPAEPRFAGAPLGSARDGPEPPGRGDPEPVEGSQ